MKTLMIQTYSPMLLIILFLTTVICDKDSRSIKCSEAVDDHTMLCPNPRYQEICAMNNLKRLYKGQNHVDFNQQKPANLYFKVPRPDSYMFMIQICSEGIQSQSIGVTALKESPHSWGKPKASFEPIRIGRDDYQDQYEIDHENNYNSRNCQIFSPQSVQNFQYNKDCSTQLLTITLEKYGPWRFKNSQSGVSVYFQVYGIDQITSLVASTGLIMICVLLCCCVCISLAVVKLIQSIRNNQSGQPQYARMQVQNYNSNPANYPYFNQYPQNPQYPHNNPNIPMGIQMSQMNVNDQNLQARNANQKLSNQKL